MLDALERYHMTLAAAYVRGAALRAGEKRSAFPWLEKPLEELSAEELAQTVQYGERHELRMYDFKKKEDLPRVRTVLGFLKGVQPESLLDVGSGRGVFLFPFLREFPWTPVTSVDLLPRRVEVLQCMSEGGMDRLDARVQDFCAWDRPVGSFDVVTALEVFEHIPNVADAVRAAVRLARRYVVVSVPSKPDNNPEHIHLLTKDILTELFRQAGCESLQFGGVPGHLTLIAGVNRQ